MYIVSVVVSYGDSCFYMCCFFFLICLQLIVVIRAHKTWFILPFSSAFYYYNLHISYCVFTQDLVAYSIHYILIVTSNCRWATRVAHDQWIVKSSNVQSAQEESRQRHANQLPVFESLCFSQRCIMQFSKFDLGPVY